MKPIVIITAPAHPYLTQRLQDKGFEVVLSEAITYNELAVIISTATGLFDLLTGFKVPVIITSSIFCVFTVLSKTFNES